MGKTQGGEGKKDFEKKGPMAILRSRGQTTSMKKKDWLGAKKREDRLFFGKQAKSWKGS